MRTGGGGGLKGKRRRGAASTCPPPLSGNEKGGMGRGGRVGWRAGRAVWMGR